MRIAKEAEDAENPKKGRSKKKKGNDEDVFSDKKKDDKAAFKMMKKKPTSPKDGVKILGEDEMDLIDE